MPKPVIPKKTLEQLSGLSLLMARAQGAAITFRKSYQCSALFQWSTRRTLAGFHPSPAEVIFQKAPYRIFAQLIFQNWTLCDFLTARPASGRHHHWRQ